MGNKENKRKRLSSLAWRKYHKENAKKRKFFVSKEIAETSSMVEGAVSILQSQCSPTTKENVEEKACTISPSPHEGSPSNKIYVNENKSPLTELHTVSPRFFEDRFVSRDDTQCDADDAEPPERSIENIKINPQPRDNVKLPQRKNDDQLLSESIYPERKTPTEPKVVTPLPNISNASDEQSYLIEPESQENQGKDSGERKTPSGPRKVVTPLPNILNASDEQSYLIEPESQEKQGKDLGGRRIVDIQYFIQQLQKTNHESLFNCNFSDLILLTEKRIGLISYFNFECKLCKKTFRICSDNPNSEDNVDVNNAAVSGLISSGIGYSQFEEIFAATNIPVFTSRYYAKIQDQVFDQWEATAAETMEKAAAREREAAIKEGRYVNGIPATDVYVDGAWCKRSYGNNYKALSGVAAIVGRRFGEVLFIGVKNKYCLVCARAEKRKEKAKEHVCYKNFVGPSSSMEAAIVCEGFKQSVDMYGLIYARVVADGDASTYYKILAADPYPGYVVSKIECRNHLLRNMCNKIRAMGKDTKYPIAQRKNITDEKIMSIRKVITTSIRENKEKPKDVAVKQLHDDIKNSINHAYGDHRQCSSYCCTKDKSIMASTVAELESTPFWFRLRVILNSMASKTISLLEDVDTNSVERFNSIIAKFVGGKRLNFALRRSYQSRCAAAVVSFNTKRPLYTLQKKLLGKSPKGSVKKLEERRILKRKQSNTTKRKKNRQIVFEKQNCYGSKVAAPDMPKDEYETASSNFLKDLSILVGDREALQERTKMQRESSEWLQIRKLLITASNFGAIIKRQKNFATLVKNILYRANISSVAAVAHGIKNEKFALQQLSTQENLSIEDCGLFVDEEYPFMGATPDGVVGTDTIVEVKCPVAAFKNGIENAIKQNKVQILKCHKKTGQVTVNTNSNWYYQVQGQLHVTRRKRCVFGIWGGETEKMEVIYIQKDDAFWKNKMEEKLKTFFNNCILPELVDSRHARGMTLRDMPAKE